MISNVGHTLQKLINNTPVFVSANNSTSTVVTAGGSVFQAGLVADRVQSSFENVRDNVSVIGRILKTGSTEDGIVYFLNDAGYVFAYNYDNSVCSPLVYEVYTPSPCGGEKAVDIATGASHILILTEKGRVFGAGDNSQYQLVPQGLAFYKSAVNIMITDYIHHDNRLCDTLLGDLKLSERPSYPKCNACCKPTCIAGDVQKQKVGIFSIDNVILNDSQSSSIDVPSFNDSQSTTPGQTTYDINIGFPLYADISYTGFVCCSKPSPSGQIPIRGTVTVSVNALYLASGIYAVSADGSTIIDVTGQNAPYNFNFDYETYTITNTIDLTGLLTNNIFQVQVFSTCGEEIPVNLNLGLPSSIKQKSIILPQMSLIYNNLVNNIFANDGFLLNISVNPDSGNVISVQVVNPGFQISADCCCSDTPCPAPVVPQACYTGVYAGGDMSVLVDDCNRMYVLGSFYEVRNNSCLLKNNSLQDLLSKTNASISLPADQLNCYVRPQNGNCNCRKCCEKPFKTDLEKFHVNLQLSDEFSSQRMTVCDFMKQLKDANETTQCTNTCEPCDNYIYIDVIGVQNTCDYVSQTIPYIVSTITLYNRTSVCKAVSQAGGCIPQPCITQGIQTIPATRLIQVGLSSVVEISGYNYCIDGVDVGLGEIVQLVFNNQGGPNVDLYIDLDNIPLGIQFIDTNASLAETDKCSKVIFNVVEENVCSTTSTSGYSLLQRKPKFLLNYGSPLDPAELANLKQLFLNNASFPCPQFKNPIQKIINTYLKGGDHVKLIPITPDVQFSTVKHAVTADLPTILRLNRSILDVGVSDQSIIALTGNVSCPNEIYSIGRNCHGELGIKSNINTTCWTKVDRCLFDCQVYRIFAGQYVTFFVTQSGRVYATGEWKCLVHCNRPSWIPDICQKLHVKDMGIGKYHLIGVGEDGSLFGLGDNQLGQLGLCHTQCVSKPINLSVFNDFNKRIYKKCKGLSNGKSCAPAGCACEQECKPWDKTTPDCCSNPQREKITYTRARAQIKYVPNERIFSKCNRGNCYY